MKRRLLCSLLLTLLCTVAAQAQIDELVIGGMISSAEDAADRLIETAADRADQTLLRAAFAAELAVDRLKVAYGESLDKTVGSLDKAERDLFNKTLQLLGELDTKSATKLDQVEDISTKLSATARSLPFAKTDPLFVARKSPDSPVLVTVQGINLAAGEPFALIGPHKLTPEIAKTDDSLTFKIPGDLLPAESFEPLKLNLVLYKETTSWLVFSSLEPRQYRVSIFPAPPVVGTLTLYGKKTEERVTVENRKTPSIKCHASHCKKDKETSRIAVNEENTVLITSSPKWHTGYENHGSASIYDVSPGGFSVRLKCSSYGCTPFSKGTRGQIKGHATYQVERRDSQVSELLLAEKKELVWGTDLRMHAPEDVLTVTAVLETMLGGSEALTPGQKGRFYSFSYDRLAQEIVVRPNSLGKVLESPAAVNR